LSSRREKIRGEVTRFGEKLRIMRQRHGYTLQALSQMLGYATRGYVSDIERGEKIPTVDFAVKAARILGVSVDILLVDELELPQAVQGSGDRED